MKQGERFDLIILGGGCAGLSLARELAQRNVKQTVLVVEPREVYKDDRSWCFWAVDRHVLSAWVSQAWPTWRFNQMGQVSKARRCTGYAYQYIRAKDFYRNSLAAIAQSSTIALRLGLTVTDLQSSAGGWVVTTPEGQYLAKEVVDTRPPTPEVVAESTLFQCFLGVEITLGKPIAVADEVELMTDMRLLNGEFCFTYILPHTDQRMLVEVTVFSNRPRSREDLVPELDRLLAERGWSNCETVRTEYAQLPMGLPDSDPYVPGQPLNAGTRGGALRASSGYGFQRIQRWARSCAQQYVDSNELVAPSAGRWLPWMDKLFLAVLKKYPELTPVLFDRLLSRTQTERFIRFMDDRATFGDCLHIVASLPKKPFVKTLISWVLKR